jgi:protein O-GlcNAc transferase
VEQADLVRVDRIDVLVNLTGYLAQYRLLFARRVAPVQVAYINHVAPTGLRTIDARITDDWIEPADGGGGDPDERLVRMASGFSCFDPPSTTRDVGPLPALRTGRVTFGYLNNFAKVSPQALDAWSSILKAVPGSRLVVKSISMSDHVLVSRLLGEFGRRGIAADCVETIGRLADDDANLAAIEGIDIGLDPFPFNGGISTAETLWMGVPVISLAGQGLVARLGLSLLSRADLADLVATTTDEYCRLAVELAQDVGRLAELRGSMRQRLLRSRLFDASAHTRELEGVFRALWARWCGGVLRTSGRPSSQSRQGRVALPGSNR